MRPQPEKNGEIDFDELITPSGDKIRVMAKENRVRFAEWEEKHPGWKAPRVLMRFRSQVMVGETAVYLAGKRGGQFGGSDVERS